MEMEINTKYGINDVVYLIRKEREQVWEICSTCKGTGRVVIGDTKPRMCPDCYGRCGNYEYKDVKWLVKATLTIGQVTAEVRNIHTDGMFDNMGEYKEGSTTYKNQYMAYETGIGSGSVYNENELFPTKEAAQEECAKLNAKIQEDKK